MAEQILAEHHSIDRALLELDSLLSGGRNRERLGRAISAFVVLLETHFHHEERSYLFTDMVEEYPRFARQIEALKQEHVEMLSEIRSIAVASDQLAPDVAARLWALMSRLGLHESHEIDLLQHAHTDDIATAD